MVNGIFRQQHFAFGSRNEHWQIEAWIQTVEFFLADASQTRCLGGVYGRAHIQSFKILIVFDFRNVETKRRWIGHDIAPGQQFWRVIARFLRHFQVFIRGQQALAFGAFDRARHIAFTPVVSGQGQRPIAE